MPRKRKTRRSKKGGMLPLYLFVYGSMRKGQPNHRLLEEPGVQFIGYYTTLDPMYMIGLKSKSFPYVVTEQIHEDLKPTPITGELYEITLAVLEKLDALEGHPSYYRRRPVVVFNVKEAKTRLAYMYILDNAELIEGIQESFHKRFVPINKGNWIKFINNS